MTKERQSLGASGEKMAADFLREKGYKILATNWRCRLGEIDLVAGDGDTLVICEVKTRSGTGFGHPLEAIDSRKQERLRRLGEYYWNTSGNDRCALRFDAVAVISDGHRMRVEHIEDAF